MSCVEVSLLLPAMEKNREALLPFLFAAFILEPGLLFLAIEVLLFETGFNSELPSLKSILSELSRCDMEPVLVELIMKGLCEAFVGVSAKFILLALVAFGLRKISRSVSRALYVGEFRFMRSLR